MTADATTTARLDAPLAPLEAHGILTAAFARSESPSDRIAYGMDHKLVDHPEWCSTEADYPGWKPGMRRCPTHSTPAVTA